MRQLRRVPQCSLDMLLLQRRVARQDRLRGGTLSKAVQNHGDRDARSLRAKISTADLRVTTKEFVPICHAPIVRSIAPIMVKSLAPTFRRPTRMPPWR
jgi:hypothetical protein